MEPVLETGILSAKRSDGGSTTQQYSIMALDQSDLPRILELQDLIVRHLHRKDILEPFPPEFMKAHLGRKGFILGLFSQGRLWAFRNVFFPDVGDKVWNLGLDIGLPRPELKRVANLQMVCVHPDYRGNGVALKLNRLALKLLRERGHFEHICATVSPYNIWNLRILLSSGFHVRELKSKYGGKLRYVVYQRLVHPVTFETDAVAHIAIEDFKEQKRMLRTGLCGVAVKEIGDAGGSGHPFWEKPLYLALKAPDQVLRVNVISSGRCRKALRWGSIEKCPDTDDSQRANTKNV